MSTTEEDLEVSVGEDAVDVLTADDTADHDGPDTAELDALDESLVGSIEQYTSDDTGPTDIGLDETGPTELGVDDTGGTVVDDTAAADDDTGPTEVGLDDTGGFSAQADDGGPDLFVEHDYVDDFVDDDETFDVPRIVAPPPFDVAPAARTGNAATTAPTTNNDVAPAVASVTGAADAGTDARAGTDTDAGTGTDPHGLPTPDAKDGGGDDDSGVSPNILEELRRADIDGPVVDAAPQDDTTSARRRPKQALDYDPAPVPVPLRVPRVLGRKPRVRKVTRVVRHVDPWSVFKIALLANLVLYVIVLTAAVLLWNVAYATGTVENIERFFESFGWQSFEFNGGELYHAGWIAGLFAVLGFTGLWVLLATLFNLITDIVGGARFTVLEEEVVESRTSPMRRFVVRRPEPEIPAVLSDASGPLIREAVVDDTGELER